MDKLNAIAQKLSDKLSTRFDQVFMRDSAANETNQPDQARFFNFIYSNDGIDYGSVTVSINDGKNLKIFFGRNVAHKIPEDLRNDWYQLLKSLRKFAGRNLLGFDARQINHKLTQKSLKDMSVQDQAVETMNEGINFGPLKGYRFKSRQRLGPVHIIIRHAQPVDEKIRGSRSRNIDTIFIENPAGERHALPFKKLFGARVMARHVANGGTVNDQIGQFICDSIAEMSNLQSLVRSSRGLQNEGASSAAEIEEACDRYRRIKEGLNNMRSDRGYRKFKESFLGQPDSQNVAVEIVESVNSGRIRELARKYGNHRLITSMRYADSRYLASTVLEDIAVSLNNRQHPLSKFALEWSRQLRMPAQRLNEGSGNERLAAQIVYQYLQGINEAARNPRESSEYNDEPDNEIDEFENWAEETAVDDPIEDYTKLETLLQKPIHLGQDGNDAIAEVDDVIDDEDLLDAITKLWDETGDWNADARPVVMGWLEMNAPELAAEIGTRVASQAEPVKETVGGDPVEDFVDSVTDPDVEYYGDNTMDEPAKIYERIKARY